jgi:Flp pilus assembly protein TadG
MPEQSIESRRSEGQSMSWIDKHGHATALAACLRRQAGRFVPDETAGTITIFALTLPVLMAAAGVAVDYSLAASTQSKMQAAADAAALASVRELQLARADSDRITAIANNVINNSVQNVTTAVNVDRQTMTVRVAIEKQYAPVIQILSGTQLHASATAKMSGSMPLCLLGLDLSAPQTIGLEHSALLTAPDCLVQSNSKNPAGVQAKNNAVMRAGMICSAGGKVQTSNANFSPAPTTDCPVLADPLSSRAAPPVGACNYTNKVVDGGYETLPPGVYCGGLQLTNGAVVKLGSGIFTIKDGPLIVDGGASISGTDVAIQLKGSAANLMFDADTTVSLSAPKDGPLAGILIFDDPSGAGAPAQAPKSGRGAAGRGNVTGAPRRSSATMPEICSAPSTCRKARSSSMR